MQMIGRVAKPTRTLTEEFQRMNFKPDDLRMMESITGETGMAKGLLATTTGAQPTPGDVTRNGSGGGAMQAPAGAAGDGTGVGGEGGEAAEVVIKKEARLKGKKTEKKDDKKDENAPAATSQGMSMPGMPSNLQPGMRPAGESSGKSGAPDRLEVILSDLQGLVHESQNFDQTKNALIRSYANISKIAQAVSEKLNEGVTGNKDLFWSLDELAEEALQVAEGLIEGTVQVRAAHDGVNGYVQDLIEHLGPIADELDSNIAAVLKGLK
jgi:hypothetical protein